MRTISRLLPSGSEQKPFAFAFLAGLLFLPRPGAAEQVHPSAEKALASGQSISEYYYQNRFRQPHILQRLTERIYWVEAMRKAALAPKYSKYQEFDTVIRSHVIWVVRQSEVHGF